jgi:hypothetical protein
VRRVDEHEEVREYEPREGKPVVAVIFGLTYAVAGVMFLWMVQGIG